MTTQAIQSAFSSVIHADAGVTIRYADCYRMAVETHGSNAALIQDELQAVIDREFNKVITSARPELKQVYRNFKRAGSSDRITKYLGKDSGGGILSAVFETTDGVSTVTITFKTPEECEKEARQAARKASKEAAEVKAAEEERELEREALRASATIEQVISMLQKRLPEITAMTWEDVINKAHADIMDAEKLQEVKTQSGKKTGTNG